MNSDDAPCAALLDHLVDLAEGGGPAPLRAHLATCAACQGRLQDSLAVRAALGKLAPVPLPAHFEADLWGRLPARRRARPGLVVAGAMALAAAVAWAVWPVAAPVDMMLSQWVQLDVEMQTPSALSDVHMHIALPDGLQLASDDAALAALRAVDYRTDLTAGVNRVNLVLRAARAGEHRVHVEVEAASGRAAVDVVLRVQRDGQARAVLEGQQGALALRFGGAS